MEIKTDETQKHKTRDNERENGKEHNNKEND